jgi:hypothetical protein
LIFIVVPSKYQTSISAFPDDFGGSRIELEKNEIVFVLEEQETGVGSVDGFSKIFHPKTGLVLSVLKDYLCHLHEIEHEIS